MKPSILVLSCLLLLSLLHSKAQGIRLEEGILTDEHRKLHVFYNYNLRFRSDMESSNLLRRSNNGSAKESILCKEGRFYCSSAAGKKAMNRKFLISSSIPSTHAMWKKAKMIENTNENGKVDWIKEETKVNSFSSPPSKHQEQVHHEELVDLAEMDYTATRRKPPIHN